MINDYPSVVRKSFKELMRQPPNKFPAVGRPNAPRCQGVYVIHGKQDEVLHVGRTTRAKRGIAQRLNDHLQGRSSFAKKLV